MPFIWLVEVRIASSLQKKILILLKLLLKKACKPKLGNSWENLVFPRDCQNLWIAFMKQILMSYHILDVKGIPEFWLTAFKNAPAIADMIEVM